MKGARADRHILLEFVVASLRPRLTTLMGGTRHIRRPELERQIALGAVRYLQRAVAVVEFRAVTNKKTGFFGPRSRNVEELDETAVLLIDFPEIGPDQIPENLAIVWCRDLRREAEFELDRAGSLAGA
jgi:hypothetical protein